MCHRPHPAPHAQPRWRARHAATWLVAGILAIASTSCSWLPRTPRPIPVDAYHADKRDLAHVRKVLVLPFVPAPGVDVDPWPVRDTFLGEMAKQQRFEIVPLPEDAIEIDTMYANMLRGRIPIEALVSVAERYNADGVVTGMVTMYRAYRPQQLGLRIKLVSAQTGTIVWAAEGNYDARDAATVEDVEHYARSHMAEEASLHGHEIVLLSPGRFSAFVCNRLASTWR